MYTTIVRERPIRKVADALSEGAQAHYLNGRGRTFYTNNHSQSLLPMTTASDCARFARTAPATLFFFSKNEGNGSAAAAATPGGRKTAGKGISL